MPDARRASRRWAAFGVALVLALLGVAFLVWSISQHEDARDDLRTANAQVAARRANTTNAAQALQHAQQEVDAVRPQLVALERGVAELGELDRADLDAVGAAITAGTAGNLTDYNAAVDRRVELDARHDAALEQLRQQANEVIDALS